MPFVVVNIGDGTGRASGGWGVGLGDGVGVKVLVGAGVCVEVGVCLGTGVSVTAGAGVSPEKPAGARVERVVGRAWAASEAVVTTQRPNTTTSDTMMTRVRPSERWFRERRIVIVVLTHSQFGRIKPVYHKKISLPVMNPGDCLQFTLLPDLRDFRKSQIEAPESRQLWTELRFPTGAATPRGVPILRQAILNKPAHVQTYERDHCDGVEVGVGVCVDVGISVGVAVGVWVGVGCAVGVGVGVKVAVAVGPGVSVGVGVYVGLGATVPVKVGVAVSVGEPVGDGDAVAMGVCVGARVGVGLDTGVSTGVSVSATVGVSVGSA